MLIAHKIALDPNNAQTTYLLRAAGTARFAYNWALAEWKRQYEAWKTDNTLQKPSETALRRQLNAIKRDKFPWMLRVTKNAPQMAIIQLGQAFQNFFAGRARYPQFRKKGAHDRFTLTNDQFSLDGCRIRIPNLGWVRMRESLRFSGKIVAATVSRVADQWFVSIAVDTSKDLHLPQAENQGAVGVDLGVLALATLSTGETIPGPKPHKALLGRLRRLSRGLSRKQKGSENRQKAKARLAKLHARIANIRKDALHKLSSDLTRRFHTIVIENLNVRGMMANRCLARSIADMSIFEFRRQLEYKTAMRGGAVKVADRFYASSKICSGCGNKLDALPLSARQWTCPVCGTHHDRDVNAAINLKNLTVSSTAAACGEDGSDRYRKTKVKPAPMKQEVSLVLHVQKC
ncbi:MULTISPECIES: RNA-guided endonuclease TnpB family protein [unclassified Thiomonas]|jgi:putative transposase|uniref:RNA-guided endonuclease InsQ/TnpB family protein n=1 Tax=unclassified Thiomonas TaxID=2625466 RepID=UPI0004DBA847|nr:MULTISPECIES: RNA-guided endonuclease TnpB family protein [unclassified Thiomonas]MDD5001049.1 RNA-guided endonuclease TnpB family protein [Thiomonas arsenitoxydans]CDW92725.1 transposase [Thiomonas sp. CB2]VDY05570.1 transposase [Thiomonas sp. Bio17B3]VDY07264.1 transposase [Thiomonas sp. Sup16B3]VDY13825.1 transposase [Thiomonas sp. OC7]